MTERGDIMTYCYVTCKWATILLGEKPIPIDQNTKYIYIGKSKYLINHVIVQEVSQHKNKGLRLLVPKEYVVIPPCQSAE